METLTSVKDFIKSSKSQNIFTFPREKIKIVMQIVR